MSMGILGRKVGMTQVFDDDGKAIPVTVIEAGPCSVVEIRTPEKNSYSAVQLGFGEVKPAKVSKPAKGYFTKQNTAPKRWLREFRIDNTADYQVGQEITVSLFQNGEVVDVTGISKGKGYQGVIKRHGFGGGAGSHGASVNHRHPGSIGCSSYPGRVPKGRRMAGQMGNERVTAKNLKVFSVDAENNLILVKGAVPGARDGLVMIRKTAK
jgi:large subunit ribosomal protein L3